MTEEIKVRRGWFQFFCGNPECPSRLAGKLHDVHVDQMEDGEVWVCSICRADPKLRRKAAQYDGDDRA